MKHHHFSDKLEIQIKPRIPLASCRVKHANTCRFVAHLGDSKRQQFLARVIRPHTSPVETACFTVLPTVLYENVILVIFLTVSARYKFQNIILLTVSDIELLDLSSSTFKTPSRQCRRLLFPLLHAESKRK